MKRYFIRTYLWKLIFAENFKFFILGFSLKFSHEFSIYISQISCQGGLRIRSLQAAPLHPAPQLSGGPAGRPPGQEAEDRDHGLRCDSSSFGSFPLQIF